VPLVQNDHVIEQIPTHTSDPALGNAVLPGTSKSGSDGFCTMLFDHRDDIGRKLRVPVEDQEPVRLVVSPSFAQLQCDPQGVGMAGYVAVKNSPSVVSDDKEAIENTKCESEL